MKMRKKSLKNFYAFIKENGIKNEKGRIIGTAFKKEGKKMTSKELLYIEDALGHEQYFQAQCQATAGQIKDQDLKNCVQQIEQRHRQIFQNLYSLL